MIIIKTDREIELMRRAGRLVGEALLEIKNAVKPGITTKELDRIAEKYIIKHKAKPSFKGYYGFPASICTSVNEEVVHGIPSKNKVLREGDIISVDCGAVLDGYHGDAARTFAVGKVSPEAEKLIEVTKESFFKGIEKAVLGNRLTDISAAVQEYVEGFGFSVVRDYVGHGIGSNMHEKPEIPNYGRSGRGPKLVKGMALAIEPMVNMGRYNVKTQSNNWTVVTMDGNLSAHYENTIAILENGPEILTLI
ncbi:type I methionyl aminopeptidase [Clostridium kluyveri]|uniref:Methionine aminopeptidase n=1 Tax=Clostridium kluyveri TaxID=1534 RepID=A0A1L5F3M4_CLOKL|nr:type I methionyl aminopeptidase [Clostridium kluyveri]APM37577.1 type I methionyl aminopeptidase [Clostridium kluyveri]UZQ52463.1 type I methionyl aminopeptidase [Clostridium kluyveri]